MCLNFGENGKSQNFNLKKNILQGWENDKEYFGNYLIKIIYYNLSEFERYKTITKENSSLMKKQFYSMFINIAISTLLVNDNFQENNFFRGISEGLPGGTQYFFNGKYSDIDRSWYVKVSLAIIVMMITNLLSSIVTTILFEVIYGIKRQCCSRRQILQIDMNSCMDGSYFNLSYKYALTMRPIPILIEICGLYFLSQYWLDRIIFLRFNKYPNYYSQSIHNSFIKILPYATFLHCIFSMWTYGSPEIFPQSFIEDGKDSSGQTKYTFQDRSFSQRLFNENSLPFFILFIVFIVIYIFENIIISIILKKIFKVYGTMDEKQPNFFDIKDKMKSKINDWTLASYNPVHNLKYNKIMMAMLDVAEVNSNIDIERILTNSVKDKNEENKENNKDQVVEVTANHHSEDESYLSIIPKSEKIILPSIHQHREAFNVDEFDNKIDHEQNGKTISDLQNSDSQKRVFDEEE